MLNGKKLIARYVIQGALPYVVLSLVLLTAILFTQQTGRFAELAIYTDLPISLAAEIAAALLPSVLILTLPVAVLAGIVIGFARMGSDSEIIALRAAGVGTWSLLWPALLIGLVVTAATVFLHFKEAPQATRDLRRVALQGALRKLDSPVDPRTFNTDIPGYVIYVRDGDKTSGSWGRVFIYAQQEDGSTRIVTARSGRIDSSNDRSELVLNDAVAMKIPKPEGAQHDYVVERLDQLRITINTGRAELLESFSKKDVTTEELDWNELRQQLDSGSLEEKNEAQRTLQRRLALSSAPLVFALFGGLLGMRVKRGGRGAGILLSIAVVVVYYLITLFGESLTRNNSVSAITGEWMATAVMLLLSLVLLRFDGFPKITFARRLLNRGASG
jgi:lipopolysaccharide export system permease protein